MTNWKQINEESLPGLTIECYRSESAKIDEKIDFAIIFNSYDSRALEYSSLFERKQIKNALLVNFQSDKSIKKEHWDKNLKVLKGLVLEEIETLEEIDIFEYYENISKILNKIPKESIFLGAKWFLDITGIPGIYFMPLMKVFKQMFPSPTLYLLNISGLYNSSDSKTVHKHFSDGIAKDILIPTYEGRPNFSKPWVYIFLLGFEGERSLSILKTNEPARSKVIIADPGYSASYVNDAIDFNKCFLHELSYEKKCLIRVDVGDPVTVYQEISKIYDSVRGKMNLCIVPLGPKPHILGACLYGLQNSEISIMSQLPRKYYLKDIKRGKYMWLYKIK